MQIRVDWSMLFGLKAYSLFSKVIVLVVYVVVVTIDE